MSLGISRTQQHHVDSRDRKEVKRIYTYKNNPLKIHEYSTASLTLGSIVGKYRGKDDLMQYIRKLI